MATYLELAGLASDENLRVRIRVACVVAAEAQRELVAPTRPTEVPEGDPGYAQFLESMRVYDQELLTYTRKRRWAAKVFRDPASESDRMLWAVLAGNNTMTVAQLTAAPDASLQSAVSAAVPLFAAME